MVTGFVLSEGAIHDFEEEVGGSHLDFLLGVEALQF